MNEEAVRCTWLKKGMLAWAEPCGLDKQWWPCEVERYEGEGEGEMRVR